MSMMDRARRIDQSKKKKKPGRYWGRKSATSLDWQTSIIVTTKKNNAMTNMTFFILFWFRWRVGLRRTRCVIQLWNKKKKMKWNGQFENGLCFLDLYLFLLKIDELVLILGSYCALTRCWLYAIRLSINPLPICPDRAAHWDYFDIRFILGHRKQITHLVNKVRRYLT